MTTALVEELVERLQLEPHPEGGYFRRVFEHAESRDGRLLASTIYYLLTRGVRSAWHRLDAVELWVHHAGDPLELSIAPDGSHPVAHVVGGDEGEPMVPVPANAWQSARSLGSHSLMVVTVVPAFVWEGFEMAPEGWSPPGAG